jgi:RNA polymerase sigma-70 factor (ECF subfamily)
MTGRTSLLGSFAPTTNTQVQAAILNNPGFMESLTQGANQARENDEQCWARLMVSAQAGNESDYRQLLSELTGVIHNFLRSRFGNHHFIEDCVQETLIAIHQARHTYDKNRPFRPWLFAIVRHKAIDTLRMQRTRQKITSQYKEKQEVLSRTSHKSEAEGEVIKGRLLELLSEQHREVLVLTKIIGFSIAEAADKLNISESLVKVRTHRAIRKLRKMMEADTL